MGKKGNKCLICGGRVEYIEKSDQYQCTECNALYEANLFTPAKNAKKPKTKIRIRWLVLIISTIYLLWLIYRFLIY